MSPNTTQVVVDSGFTDTSAAGVSAGDNLTTALTKMTVQLKATTALAATAAPMSPYVAQSSAYQFGGL